MSRGSIPASLTLIAQFTLTSFNDVVDAREGDVARARLSACAVTIWRLPLTLARIRGGQACVMNGCRRMTYFTPCPTSLILPFQMGAAGSFHSGPNAFGALPNRLHFMVYPLLWQLANARERPDNGVGDRPEIRFYALSAVLAELPPQIGEIA